MRRALVLCAFLLTAATASAQSYNPHAGDSVAPSSGTVVVPATPNGVAWLNSMLGLSPSFLQSDGKVSSQYLGLDNYLPLSGGDITGPVTAPKINGVTYSMVKGVSASGDTVSLTTDGNAPTAGNCYVAPNNSVSRIEGTFVGIAADKSAAVEQWFNGGAVFNLEGTVSYSSSGAANAYPATGSVSSWSVVPSVDAASGCLVFKAKATAASGSSWNWQGSVRVEAFGP